MACDSTAQVTKPNDLACVTKKGWRQACAPRAKYRGAPGDVWRDVTENIDFFARDRMVPPHDLSMPPARRAVT